MKLRLLLLLFSAAFAVAADQGPVVAVRQPVARESADKEFVGRVEPVESVEVHTAIRGDVAQVHCKVGDEVKKGDLLIELSTELLNKELEGAQANVKKKEEAVAEATKKLDKLQKDKAKDVDIEKARAEVEVAEVVLKLARREVDKVRRDLEQTRITAPLAGRVSKVANVEKGKPAPTLLCTIARTDQVAVAFEVDEHSWLQMEHVVRESKGKIDSVTKLPVAFALPDEKDFPHAGAIDSVDNHLDANTRSIGFRAVFPNKDGKLTDAAFTADDKKKKARVRLSVGPARKVLLVPTSVVSADVSGDKHILVVNDNNVVESRTVKLGSLLDGMQVVEEGLKPDDWVITGVEPAKRDPMDKTLSPEDFIKDLRTFGLKPGTTVAPVRVKSSSPADK
jgi:RND family efflux transporter MFP subunit